MTLAVMHAGDRGFCTSGQIMPALGLLAELPTGLPSAASTDAAAPVVELNDAEVRERMSGNLCRCSCYPDILAAVLDAARGDAAR
ncbi:MAG: 2Fe-2S iron-sulfur cluster-binding protein [Methylocella sp.]